VLRLLVVILAAVMGTMFAMDNMHHVELGLLVGRPVQVRLFFLLLTSFLVGCFSMMLLNVYRRSNPKTKRGTARDAKEEEFFSD
jgi:uncharacterized integral membrane protein